MGVCYCVKDLAERIAASKPLSPSSKLIAEILMLMPMYLDVGRLDAWEAASQAILPDDDQTAADELLLEVWDFGRFNLYAAFEQVATNNQYTKLRALLAKHGIDSEEAPDLSGW